MGCFEVLDLCQRSHCHPHLEAGYCALYRRNSANFMQKNQRLRICQKIPLGHFPDVLFHTYILYSLSINKGMTIFYYIPLYFLSKLLPAGISGHPLNTYIMKMKFQLARTYRERFSIMHVIFSNGNWSVQEMHLEIIIIIMRQAISGSRNQNLSWKRSTTKGQRIYLSVIYDVEGRSWGLR